MVRLVLALDEAILLRMRRWRPAGVTSLMKLSTRLGDATKAETVIKNDDLVDSVYHNLFNELLALMMEDPRNIRRANSLLFVAKHLERLGDHATNVAEMVIYMVRGTDVRHPGSRATPATATS